jgi:hypothetical protein
MCRIKTDTVTTMTTIICDVGSSRCLSAAMCMTRTTVVITRAWITMLPRLTVEPTRNWRNIAFSCASMQI